MPIAVSENCVFTAADAGLLRQSLPLSEFTQVSVKDGLAQTYAQFYGLEFDTLDWSVNHALSRCQSQEFDIVCQYFAVPQDIVRGTVFIVHGYYDHAGLYQHLIRHCLKLGFSVMAFDLPGHGLSSGPRAGIKSFTNYTEALHNCLKLAANNQLAQPWHGIGQSTGAATLIQALVQGDKSVLNLDKIIFLAPLLRPRAWLSGQLTYFLFKSFVTHSSRNFADNSHDTEFLTFIRERDPLQSQRLAVSWVGALRRYIHDFAVAPKCPKSVYIIQGTDDSTVDWQYNLPRLQTKFPGSQTRFVNDARHHLVNESLQYREPVFRRIEEILKAGD